MTSASESSETEGQQRDREFDLYYRQCDDVEALIVSIRVGLV